LDYLDKNFGTFRKGEYFVLRSYLELIKPTPELKRICIELKEKAINNASLATQLDDLINDFKDDLKKHPQDLIAFSEFLEK
jgi:hypothetical protein